MISENELDMIREALINGDFSSVLINKRDPITYRLYYNFSKTKRVCLHKMMWGETKPHPHKYNVRVLVLSGEYIHKIYNENIEQIYEEVVNDGSSYEISRYDTHHSVNVVRPTFSIMFNDYNFPIMHESCISTQGKNLKEISENEKRIIENEFLELIDEYIDNL